MQNLWPVLLATLAPAQEVPLAMPSLDLGRAPLVPAQSWAASQPPPPAPGPVNRLRMLGIAPVLLEDAPAPEEERPAVDDGPGLVTFAFGNDNPYFDLRQRGAPGGVGYTRVDTQVQILGTERTALSLGVRAVTPTGLQYDGLPDSRGSTVVCPALSVFHALDEATAVQAFVARNMPVQNSGAACVSRDVQCGMAVQRPLSTSDDDPLRKVYLSLGALGQYRTEGQARAPAVDFLPGLHYQCGESWWVSGAVTMPVGQRDASQAWQLTCACQF